MSRLDPNRPPKCVVAINLSHSTDAILRKSETSRVGLVGAPEHLQMQPTLTVVQLIHPLIFCPEAI